MNKVYILGLDGLDFNFVKKWNLKILQQLEFDETIVPIDKEKGFPMSPQVWGSFLTGKHESQNFQYESSPLSMLSFVLNFLRKYIKKIDFTRISQKILPKILPDRLWQRQVIGLTNLQNKTFLDLTKSKPINVIFYNQDPTIHVVYYYFSIGENSLEKTFKLTKSLYIKNKKQILNKTKQSLNSYELIFSYLPFPDVFQHILMFRLDEIKSHYYDLEEFVTSIKSLIPESSLFLIISDHGFNLKTGFHSNFGFYSSNKPLKPKPKHITDFFQLIIDKIGAKSPK